jgi:predicted phosphodiesterase
MSIKSDIVKKYMKKYPTKSNRNLAMTIYYNENNDKIFKDPESVRTLIRIYKGQKGKKSRDSLVDRRFLTNIKINGKNYDMPVSDNKPLVNYILTRTYKKILLISDLHIPFHDVGCIETILKFGKKYKPDCIIILGDLIDCYKLSKYQPDPRNRDFNDEIIMVNIFFKTLRKLFPTIKILYQIGNHEQRYINIFKTKAPELLNIEHFNFSNLLNLSKYKINLIDSGSMIDAGKITLDHGLNIFGRCTGGKHPGYKMVQLIKSNVATGHFHRSDEYIERGLKTSMIGGWSIGCCCTLEPHYLPVTNNHNHGFATINFEKNGNFNFNNYKILNGKIL